MKTIKLLSLLGIQLFMINKWSIHPKENIKMWDSAMAELQKEEAVNIPSILKEFKKPKVWFEDKDGNRVDDSQEDAGGAKDAGAKKGKDDKKDKGKGGKKGKKEDKKGKKSKDNSRRDASKDDPSKDKSNTNVEETQEPSEEQLIRKEEPKKSLYTDCCVFYGIPNIKL